jgi:hypothetical protein
MSAKSLFDDACKDATVDSEELQALYASYIKDLNYGGNTPLYKGLIFTNRYLKADYAATAEAQFYYNIELFSVQLKTYIESADKTEIKKAHKAISNFFKDESLFYPLKRTIPVNIENFTVGVNDDSSRFAIILAADEIAMDGENITIPFREQLLEARTRELLKSYPDLLVIFEESLSFVNNDDKMIEDKIIHFNQNFPDSLKGETEIVEFLQTLELLPASCGAGSPLFPVDSGITEPVTPVQTIEEKTRELLGKLNPKLLENFNEFLKDKVDSYIKFFNENLPLDDSLTKETEIYEYLQGIGLCLYPVKEID